MGPDAMSFVFECWVLSQFFSLSSFIFIKGFFSSTSLSAIRLVSFAYLRCFFLFCFVLIFSLAILIRACDSSNPAFHMHISEISRVTIYSLDVLFPNFEPILCSMSSPHCCILPCIQVFQETGKVVWYTHLFSNFLHAVIHTVKDFRVVNEAEVDVFLWNSVWSSRCWHFFSGYSAFSKFSLYVWKFSVHVLLKPSLKDFKHYLASPWNEHYCMTVQTFFGIALLWYWNENWPFPVLCPFLSFLNLLSYWVQRFNSNHLLGF